MTILSVRHEVVGCTKTTDPFNNQQTWHAHNFKKHLVQPCWLCANTYSVYTFSEGKRTVLLQLKIFKLVSIVTKNIEKALKNTNYAIKHAYIISK